MNRWRHTAYNIPIIIRDFLLDAFKDDPHRRLSPQAIGDILSRSITSFDDAIARDVLKLFPGGMSALREMSNAQIAAIINDQYDDGRGAGCNYNKARLCMYGTTALISLVDPERENLWVANLGDCQAGKGPFFS
jgi:pyruvate dehydrogenase phosphatase